MSVFNASDVATVLVGLYGAKQSAKAHAAIDAASSGGRLSFEQALEAVARYGWGLGVAHERERYRAAGIPDPGALPHLTDDDRRRFADGVFNIVRDSQPFKVMKLFLDDDNTAARALGAGVDIRADKSGHVTVKTDGLRHDATTAKEIAQALLNAAEFAEGK